MIYKHNVVLLKNLFKDIKYCANSNLAHRTKLRSKYIMFMMYKSKFYFSVTF